jgi:anti-sigma B factor antagonist
MSYRDAGEGVCVVAPAGEIDLASAPRLKSSLVKLLEEGYTRFVADLSEVSYLDSTGLGVLIAFARRLGDPADLVLAGAPAQVVGLLELTGLDAAFTSFATVDEALAPAPAEQHAVHPPLCPDASIVVGLAAAALPFAESSQDELRRWVRILSVHGQAARALQCVGLTDVNLEEPVVNGIVNFDDPQAHADSVVRVTKAATAIAVDRQANCVSTVDLLLAVMSAYPEAFDRELHAHGSSSIDLIDCLGTAPELAAIA